MSAIKIVTYLRANESINANIKLIIEVLRKTYSQLSIVIFVDMPRDIEEQISIPMQMVNFPGTKYSRMRKMLKSENDSILISIDNDTTIIPDNFLFFIRKFLSGNYDIAWGAIYAVGGISFIGRMIVVDKLLSHTIIRPFLWRLGVGISIPGQLFILKSKSFFNKLFDFDTFLDDLALGIYVNVHLKSLKILMSDRVIGMEMPKINFKDLYLQRKRWAKGFYTIWKGIKGTKERKLIRIHCFFYHFLWILNWGIAALLFYIKWPLAIIFLCLVSIIISRKDLRYLFDSFVYQLFFPIIHIIWMINFLRGDRNDNNA